MRGTLNLVQIKNTTYYKDTSTWILLSVACTPINFQFLLDSRLVLYCLRFGFQRIAVSMNQQKSVSYPAILRHFTSNTPTNFYLYGKLPSKNIYRYKQPHGSSPVSLEKPLSTCQIAHRNKISLHLARPCRYVQGKKDRSPSFTRRLVLGNWLFWHCKNIYLSTFISLWKMCTETREKNYCAHYQCVYTVFCLQTESKIRLVIIIC